MTAYFAQITIHPSPAYKKAAATSRQSTEDSHELPLLDPWMDMRRKIAIYCTRELMEIQPVPFFAAPTVPLQDFIEHVIKHSGAPMAAAAGALEIIEWMTSFDKAPLSSSPHHLFISAFVIVAYVRWGVAWDEEAWEEMTNGHIPRSEISTDSFERVLHLVEDAKLDMSWNVKCWTGKDCETEFREMIWEMSVHTQILDREDAHRWFLKEGRQSLMAYDRSFASLLRV